MQLVKKASGDGGNNAQSASHRFSGGYRSLDRCPGTMYCSELGSMLPSNSGLAIHCESAPIWATDRLRDNARWAISEAARPGSCQASIMTADISDSRGA